MRDNETGAMAPEIEPYRNCGFDWLFNLPRLGFRPHKRLLKNILVQKCYGPLT